MRRIRAREGQASIELLAMVPLLILAGLLAWQLMAVLVARPPRAGRGAGPGPAGRPQPDGRHRGRRHRGRPAAAAGGAGAEDPGECRDPDPVRSDRDTERGQAAPLALAVGMLVVLGAVALFVLGRVQLAAAQAQTAADVAAISAGREMWAHLGEIAVEGPAGAAKWRARLTAVSAAAAAPGGARVESLSIPGGAWPPTAVEVVVSSPGPRGSRVRAVARAGVVVSAGASGGGPVGRASGGGYSGPLVYRDGKPMCPAVGAAFDLMDAAAHGSGVDLVGDQRLSQRRRAGGAVRPPPRPQVGRASRAEPPSGRDRARPQHGQRGLGARVAGRERDALRVHPAVLLGALALRVPAGVRRRRRSRGVRRGDRACPPGFRPGCAR